MSDTVKPRQVWRSNDGTASINVNSVGWRGDREMAWGIGNDEETGRMTLLEIPVADLLARYTLTSTTP